MKWIHVKCLSCLLRQVQHMLSATYVCCLHLPHPLITSTACHPKNFYDPEPIRWCQSYCTTLRPSDLANIPVNVPSWVSQGVYMRTYVCFKM